MAQWSSLFESIVKMLNYTQSPFSDLCKSLDDKVNLIASSPTGTTMEVINENVEDRVVALKSESHPSAVNNQVVGTAEGVILRPTTFLNLNYLLPKIPKQLKHF